MLVNLVQHFQKFPESQKLFIFKSELLNRRLGSRPFLFGRHLAADVQHAQVRRRQALALARLHDVDLAATKALTNS